VGNVTLMKHMILPFKLVINAISTKYTQLVLTHAFVVLEIIGSLEFAVDALQELDMIQPMKYVFHYVVLIKFSLMEPVSV
jgi:hypothetical protein